MKGLWLRLITWSTVLVAVALGAIRVGLETLREIIVEDTRALVIAVIAGVIFEVVSRIREDYVNHPRGGPIDPHDVFSYFLYYLPASMRDDIIGDLEITYRKIVASHGKPRADAWYCYAVTCAAVRCIGTPVYKLFAAIFKMAIGLP